MPAVDTSGISSTDDRMRFLHWLFPDWNAASVEMEAPLTTFGRDVEGPGRVHDSEASRFHAEIRRDGPLFVLRDLGSTNGTFVNGKRVVEAVLSAGDVVRIGESLAIFAREKPDVENSSFDTLAPGLFAGPILHAALESVRRAAAVGDLPIILQGETGTGKERVARAIHGWSGRSGQFVAVNCAAMPEAMAEGELFGYRRGAFTGAERSHVGLFRAADRGTLLLDEILDLSPSLQAKILRVLEEREVTPLGESRPVRIDIRLVAAAQGSVEQAVEEKRFRPDLYARLDGVTVRLPPLRERVREVPFLFMRMLDKYAPDRCPAVAARLIEDLCLYDWPFNVREMDLLVRRLITLHGSEPVLKRSYLPDRMLGRTSSPGDEKIEPAVRLMPAPEIADDTMESLISSLRRSGGNVARAASVLGISRQRAYRLMEGKSDILAEIRQKPIGEQPDQTIQTDD